MPKSWKDQFPEIPWPDIASIGNVLRHNCTIVDHRVIYELKGEPLVELERVVRAMKLKYGS